MKHVRFSYFFMKFVGSRIGVLRKGRLLKKIVAQPSLEGGAKNIDGLLHTRALRRAKV